MKPSLLSKSSLLMKYAIEKNILLTIEPLLKNFNIRPNVRPNIRFSCRIFGIRLFGFFRVRLNPIWWIKIVSCLNNPELH